MLSKVAALRWIDAMSAIVAFTTTTDNDGTAVGVAGDHPARAAGVARRSLRWCGALTAALPWLPWLPWLPGFRRAPRKERRSSLIYDSATFGAQDIGLLDLFSCWFNL